MLGTARHWTREDVEIERGTSVVSLSSIFGSSSKCHNLDEIWRPCALMGFFCKACTFPLVDTYVVSIMVKNLTKRVGWGRE
jgi:hypothetical protein